MSLCFVFYFVTPLATLITGYLTLGSINANNFLAKRVEHGLHCFILHHNNPIIKGFWWTEPYEQTEQHCEWI